ncbi:MAG: mechanosensitive ion channel family protein [Moraxellaceae bacterium]
MPLLSRFLLGIFSLLLVLASPALLADTAGTGVPEARLGYMSRTIIVFRGELAGAAPQQRVARAHQRIEEAEDRNLANKTQVVPMALGTQQGLGVFAGDLLLFTVLPDDVNPEEHKDMAALAAVAQKNMDTAFAAYHEQQNPVLLGRALLVIAIASVLALAGTWLVWRLRGFLTQRLQAFIARRLHGDVSWFGYLVKFFESVVQVLIGLLFFAIAYLWLTFALAQFPITQPFGNQLGQFLIDLLARIGTAFVSALPDMVTLLVIILITRALAQSVHAIFDAVHDGRVQLPGLHKETLGATRRIVIVAIWALGITFCYPYIPGSQSDVFKGLSVLFGFMFTLGSAGVVSQLMGGMTLVYSRALRRGDLVQVGEIVGVVQEVGALSTKIVNLYMEEVTIPNAVIIGTSIRNLSCLHESRGIRIGSKITIGYDTPWRQVHAMMQNAAARVPSLRADPAPYVLQRALSDFYVEYELIAVLDDPFARAQVLSDLHAEIQDEFNTHGVQIMSPNFEAQPEGNVLVPKEDWFKSPAKPAPGKSIPE